MVRFKSFPDLNTHYINFLSSFKFSSFRIENERENYFNYTLGTIQIDIYEPFHILYRQKCTTKETTQLKNAHILRFVSIARVSTHLNNNRPNTPRASSPHHQKTVSVILIYILEYVSHSLIEQFMFIAYYRRVHWPLHLGCLLPFQMTIKTD